MAQLLDEQTQYIDQSTGELIVNGSIYIGAQNLDPKLNLITIYSDRDLLVPIANPQLTGADGRAINKIWIPEEYSLAVYNSNDVQKYISLDSGTEDGYTNAEIDAEIAANKTTKYYDTIALAVADIANINIGDVIYPADRGGTWDAVDATTVTENEFNIVTGNATVSFQLRSEEERIASQWGAPTDGTTDARSALASVDAAGDFRLTKGTYRISSNITIANTVTFDAGAKLTIDTGVTVTFSKNINSMPVHIFDGLGNVTLPSTESSEPIWWGAELGGESTDALNKALGSGSVIVLIRGVYQYSSVLTMPQGVSFIGFGSFYSVLQSTFADGTCIIQNGSNRIENIKLTTSVTRTSGATVEMEGSASKILTCEIENYYIGVSSQAASPSSPYVKNEVINTTMRTDNIVSGSGGVLFENYSNAVVDQIVMSGPSSGTQPGFGLRLTNGDTALISNANITLHGAGLKLNPGTGQNLFATQIINSLFDSATGFSSGEITPTGTGNVMSTKINNTWFGLSNQQGLLLSHGTGVVDGLELNGCEFIGNTDSGIRANGTGIKNISVNGGWSSGNANGVNFSGGISDFKVIGITCGAVGGRSANTSNSIVIQTGASDNYIISLNNVNTDPAISDSGTGVNKLVSNNI